MISVSRNSPPRSRRRFKRLPIPSPRNARPVIGSKLARNLLPSRNSPAVVVTLGNVLITSVTVEELEPSRVTGFVEGVHVVPPPGSPAEHAIEIEAVNTDKGVIWIG